MNDTSRSSVRLTRAAALAIALGACWPTQASAQSGAADGSWRFAATIYGFLPTVGGSSSVPVDTGGSSIDIDAGDILDRLKFMFMGSLDAHNGRWGVFTDLLYVNLAGDKDQTRDFTIGNAGIPAGTSANIGWDFKGTVWTLAGQYRVVSDPSITLDVLGGSRMFQARQTIRWNINGSLGPISPAGRAGESSSKVTNWDAIVGVKGRYSFGERWSLPFYADIGTGESDRTHQLAAGVSYKFSWGELVGMWRYLDYEMKPGKVIQDISFNGPMIGATFRW